VAADETYVAQVQRGQDVIESERAVSDVGERGGLHTAPCFAERVDGIDRAELRESGQHRPVIGGGGHQAGQQYERARSVAVSVDAGGAVSTGHIQHLVGRRTLPQRAFVAGEVAALRLGALIEHPS
jgi:hypothetical protein